MPHVVITTCTGWSMVRHRREQLIELRKRGWRVSAVSALDPEHVAQLRDIGVEPYRISCEKTGLNPLKLAAYFIRLLYLLWRLRPDVVHNFASKPIILGTMAAKHAGVPTVVCTFPGMGILGTGQRQAAHPLIRMLYRLVLRMNSAVIFQNVDNMRYFVERGLVNKARCVHIAGCGVDIAELKPNFRRDGSPLFVVVSRMLWSKGIREFVEAAKIVKRVRRDAEFWLVGGSRRSTNPDCISDEWLDEVTANGDVKWIGHVPPHRAEEIMRDATGVVLLSQAEGIPRALIEAAALGTPIITTDAPGCRDVVEDGKSGFLCNGAAPQQAADAMLELIDNPQLVAEMGMAGRAIAQKFDKERVMAETLRVYGRK